MLRRGRIQTQSQNRKNVRKLRSKISFRTDFREKTRHGTACFLCSSSAGIRSHEQKVMISILRNQFLSSKLLWNTTLTDAKNQSNLKTVILEQIKSARHKN